MTPEQRNQIIDAAVALYSSKERPLLDAVADQAGVPAVTIRDAYHDYNAVLDDFYVRALERRDARLAALPPDDSSPLEERLGARLFLLLDEFESSLPFVRQTFDRRAARWGSPFRARVAADATTALDGADVPGLNQAALLAPPVLGALVEILMQTLRLWIADDSENRSRSTAFADRLLAFFSELATTRSIERALDVFRYAAGAGYIPFVGGWYERHRA